MVLDQYLSQTDSYGVSHTLRAGGREVRGSLVKMILSYVRRALGEEAVARVLAATGKQRAVSELAGPGTWAAREDILAVAEAAATVCGDPEIGRRSGEEMMRVAHERGTVDFVRGTGSIAAALEFACNMGTKMSAGRVFELGEGLLGLIEGACCFLQPPGHEGGLAAQGPPQSGEGRIYLSGRGLGLTEQALGLLGIPEMRSQPIRGHHECFRALRIQFRGQIQPREQFTRVPMSVIFVAVVLVVSFVRIAEMAVVRRVEVAAEAIEPIFRLP